MGHTRLWNNGAFCSLPIELNKAIAHELASDKDIATFRLLCRATNDAVDADNQSFWRAKFCERFALGKRESNRQLQKLYQQRSKLLRRGVGYDYFRGHRDREKNVVYMLRDLIVESFQGPPEIDDHGRPRCKNQIRLLEFVANSKILLNDRRAPPPGRNEVECVDGVLLAVKLMCSHFLFELQGRIQHIFGMEESQRAVYTASNYAKIFHGPSHTAVNMDWLSHCLNFFRHHMMSEDARTLHGNMSELSEAQKPSAWQEALNTGAYPLRRHWKGTYAFLEASEIAKLRRMDPDKACSEYFMDQNVDEGKIQSLELEFMPRGKHMKWPQVFEDRLHSLNNSGEPRIKTQGRSKSKPTNRNGENIQFVGTGEDLDDDFNAVGWLNPLPPQWGIPGWQRITFMKHFMENFDEVEQDNLWAYEGVVLPGGRIILGRWWYASEQVNLDNDYNGPFILWAVDPEPDLDHVYGKDRCTDDGK